MPRLLPGLQGAVRNWKQSLVSRFTWNIISSLPKGPRADIRVERSLSSHRQDLHAGWA